MDILAIVQARMGSTRLPGKVMRPILGIPMIELLLNRLSKAKLVNRIIIATSTEENNKPLVDLIEKLGYEVYIGSDKNVLERYYYAAKLYQPEAIVRITGDCPLIDPIIIDAIIKQCLDSGVDYASNLSPPTYPDGLDVEVIRFSCLTEAYMEAKLPSEQEHVTTFIRQHPERFNQLNYASDVDNSKLRWTVDEAEDFEFVKVIYERLYFDKPNFTTNDILGLLRSNPELQLINSLYDRNEGYRKSIKEDVKLTAKRRV